MLQLFAPGSLGVRPLADSSHRASNQSRLLQSLLWRQGHRVTSGMLVSDPPVSYRKKWPLCFRRLEIAVWVWPTAEGRRKVTLWAVSVQSQSQTHRDLQFNVMAESWCVQVPILQSTVFLLVSCKSWIFGLMLPRSNPHITQHYVSGLSRQTLVNNIYIKPGPATKDSEFHSTLIACYGSMRVNREKKHIVTQKTMCRVKS